MSKIQECFNPRELVQNSKLAKFKKLTWFSMVAKL